MKETRLNNGVTMPAIGFGVYQIPREQTEQAVTDAIEVGYRMIDTAASYFNEREVGNAIRRCGVPRSQLFVTTKLWVQDYEYDDALRAFDASMDRLQTDYSTCGCCTSHTAITMRRGALPSDSTRRGA